MEKETTLFSQETSRIMPSENFPRLINQLQETIHTTIKEIGGYWSPLSAFARVSEELGEISEILLRKPLDREAFGAELADIFIITTCLANQYRVRLSDEYQRLNLGSSYPVSIKQSEVVPSLAIQIGKMARILNYYEGQKKKKSSDEKSSLREEIPKLHLFLFAGAKIFNIDLISKVKSTLDKSKRRDKGRFDIVRDPVTEETLDHFQHVVDTTLCPFAAKAKLWGAMSWENELSLEENVLRSIPSFARFSKVCGPEGLDGFIFEAIGKQYSSSIENMTQTLKKILYTLSTHNPTGYNCMEDNIESPTWRFSFADQTYFVSVFSSLYGAKHTRYSPLPNSLFIFFQPESSFDHNSIHKANPKRSTIKQNIRAAFASDGRAYNSQLVEQRIEALKYLKPLKAGDEPIRWWEK